jgi:phosphopantothenoylcysteine synthetase/decarboxylase
MLTPVAATWVDIDALAAVSGNPVRVHPRQPDEQDPLPTADAVLAAPLTFNTINKWAAGISDGVALGLLSELLVGGPPIVAAPCAKAALRAHPAYGLSIDMLASAGVTVMDPETIVERGPDQLARFRWPKVVRALDRSMA